MKSYFYYISNSVGLGMRWHFPRLYFTWFTCVGIWYIRWYFIDCILHAYSFCGIWCLISYRLYFTCWFFQWDLVCNDNFMVDLSSTIYMVGNTVGALCLTPLSDKFGRKWVILSFLWIQGVIGIATAFSSSYIMFTVLRFFIGHHIFSCIFVAYWFFQNYPNKMIWTPFFLRHQLLFVFYACNGAKGIFLGGK